MKLSKVQWIGVALSILWAAGAGTYTHKADVERANDFAGFAYKVCSHTKAVDGDADMSSCNSKRVDSVALFMRGSSGNVALAALVPIPFRVAGGIHPDSRLAHSGSRLSSLRALVGDECH